MQYFYYTVIEGIRRETFLREGGIKDGDREPYNQPLA
jgi:hypothetical protein